MLQRKFSLISLGSVALLALVAGLLLSSRLEYTPELNAVSPTVKELENTASDSLGMSGMPSFVRLAKKLNPAVVNISTTKTIKGGGRVFRQFRGPLDDNFEDFFGKEFFERFFGDTPPKDHFQKSLGSGFIINEEGYILTNNHVIEKADKILVKLSNKKEYDAKVIGRDPETDLALIKINVDENLPFIELGDSDNLETGEWVVAIGNPFGLEHTVTAGIVSAKGRVIGAGRYDDFIQTDASINFGNSGGPLINIQGNVIGINTAIIAGGQGIGFAIPINMAKTILPQLKNKGKVIRGWLGVKIQDLTPELAEYYDIKQEKGAYIAEVIKGNPADKAGIKPGDIILEIDGQEISNSRELLKQVARIPVGKKVRVKIIRIGKTKTLTIEAGERPGEENIIVSQREETTDHLGIMVHELTPDIISKHKFSDSEGVLVSEVKQDSLAEKAGIKRGDIIKEINHKTIKNLDDYFSIIKDLKKDKKIAFLLRRGFSIVVIEINR